MLLSDRQSSFLSSLKGLHVQKRKGGLRAGHKIKDRGVGSSDLPDPNDRKVSITGMLTLFSGVGQLSAWQVKKTSSTGLPGTSPHQVPGKWVRKNCGLVFA